MGWGIAVKQQDRCSLTAKCNLQEHYRHYLRKQLIALTIPLSVRHALPLALCTVSFCKFGSAFCHRRSFGMARVNASVLAMRDHVPWKELIAWAKSGSQLCYWIANCLKTLGPPYSNTPCLLFSIISDHLGLASSGCVWLRLELPCTTPPAGILNYERSIMS